MLLFEYIIHFFFNCHNSVDVYICFLTDELYMRNTPYEVLLFGEFYELIATTKQTIDSYILLYKCSQHFPWSTTGTLAWFKIKPLKEVCRGNKCALVLSQNNIWTTLSTMRHQIIIGTLLVIAAAIAGEVSICKEFGLNNVRTRK